MPFLLVFIARFILLKGIFVVSLFCGMAKRAVLQLYSSLLSAAYVHEPLAGAVQLWGDQQLFGAEGNV